MNELISEVYQKSEAKMLNINELITKLLSVTVPLVYGLGTQLPENEDLKLLNTYINNAPFQNVIENIPNLDVLLAKLKDYVQSGVVANRNLKPTDNVVPNGTFPNAICATVALLKILANNNLSDRFYKKNTIDSLFIFYKKELKFCCAVEHNDLITMTILINKVLKSKNFTENTIKILSTDFISTYFKSTAPLQKECVHLFETIIKEYASERNFFFEELKLCLPKLNASCFRKDGKVTIFTKLFLYLSESFTLPDTFNDRIESTKKSLYYREIFKILWKNIQEFIELFVNTCDSNELNNSFNRELFNHFTMDLLSIAEDVNYPMSSLILTALLKKLQSHMKRRGSTFQNRRFILDCLHMLAPMFGYFREDINVLQMYKTLRNVFPNYTHNLDWLDYNDPVHVRLLLQKFLLDYNEMEIRMENQRELYLCVWIEEYFQKCIANTKQKVHFLLKKPDYNKSDLFMEINVDEIDVRKLIYKAVFFIENEDVFNHFVDLIEVVPKHTPTLRPQVYGFLKDVCLANPKYLLNKKICACINQLLYQKPKDYQCIRDILVTMFSALIVKDSAIRDLYITPLYDTIFDFSLTVNKKAITMFGQLSDSADYPGASFLSVVLLRRFDGVDNSVTSTLVNTFQAKYFTNSDKNTIVKLTDFVTTQCTEFELNKFEQIIKLIIKGEGEEKRFNCSNTIHSIIRIVASRIKELIDTNPDNSLSEITKFLSVLEFFSRCVHDFPEDIIVKLLVVLEPTSAPPEHVIKYVKVVQNLRETLHDVKFLCNVEERLLKLIKRLPGVVHDVMGLLCHLVKCTGRQSSIRKRFTAYYAFITRSDNVQDVDFDSTLHFVAAGFTYFALEDLKVKIITTSNFQEKVIDVFMGLIPQKSEVALEGLAAISTRYKDIILQPDVFNLYQTTLKNTGNPRGVLIVLKCILNLLKMENSRQASKNEHTTADSLIGTGDGSKEYSITAKIVTSYLDTCLSAYLTLDLGIKVTTVRIINFLVSLRLFNCHEIVPHLLALATDAKNEISLESVEVLSRIHSTFPKILPHKAMLGVQQSFLLQRILYSDKSSLLRGACVCPHTSRVLAKTRYIFNNLKSADRRTFLANIIQAIGNTNNEDYQRYIFYLAENIVNFNYYNKEDLLFLTRQIEDVLTEYHHLIYTLKERILKPYESEITLTGDFEKIPTELFCELTRELLWVYGASLLHSIKLILGTNYNITKTAVQKYSKDLSEKKAIKPEDALIMKFITLTNDDAVKRLFHIQYLKNPNSSTKKKIIDDINEVLKIYDTDVLTTNEISSENEDGDYQPVSSKVRKITMFEPGTSKPISL